MNSFKFLATFLVALLVTGASFAQGNFTIQLSTGYIPELGVELMIIPDSLDKVTLRFDTNRCRLDQFGDRSSCTRMSVRGLRQVTITPDPIVGQDPSDLRSIYSLTPPGDDVKDLTDNHKDSLSRTKLVITPKEVRIVYTNEEGDKRVYPMSMEARFVRPMR